MDYNRCGNSGLLLPKVSLGCWHNFGQPDDPNEAKKMLFHAFDNGITHFDLANNYGPPPGAAERFVGSVLASEFADYRDELIISSKAGYLMWPGPYGEWGSRKNLISSLDQSLKRLKLDYVDIFYSHRPDPNTPLEETIGALDHVVRQGKALYAGISSYDPLYTARAIEIANSLGTPITIHQPSYNMIHRHIEDGLLDVCGKNGVGMIVFCPLAQGLLTNKYLNGIPEDSRANTAHGFLKKEMVTETLVAGIKALHDIAESRGQSLAQMALSWAMRDTRVTSVLIGASRVAQLEDNLKIMNAPELTADELEQIESVLSKIKS
jgi:L-glyceraldehyde 3-phosphate reductase